MADIDKSITFLIVDDKRNMRRTIRNMLRQMGFSKFVEADDGDTALNILRNDNIDFVLCDWNMPRLPGIEVLRTVRSEEALRDIPFLIVTAEVGAETVAEAGEVDVDGYIIKPFTPEVMYQKICAIWERKTTPSPIDIHLELGHVYLKARQHDRALEEFRKALLINTSSPRTLHCLGLVHEQKKNFEAARDCFDKAVELAPNFLRARESLCDVYLALGDPEKAAYHLEQAVRISPRNVTRQIRLGKLFVELGRHDDAKRIFQDVLEQARAAYAETVVQIGEALLAVGLVTEAEAAFRQGLESHPNDITLINRLGIALRRQGKHQEAVETYKKALANDPDNESLYYNMARALLAAGDKDRALAAINRALALDPDFPEAKEFLAKLRLGIMPED